VNIYTLFRSISGFGSEVFAILTKCIQRFPLYAELTSNTQKKMKNFSLALYNSYVMD